MHAPSITKSQQLEEAEVSLQLKTYKSTQCSVANAVNVDLFNQALAGLQIGLWAAAPAEEGSEPKSGDANGWLSMPWVGFTMTAGSVCFSLAHSHTWCFFPFLKHDTLKQLYSTNEQQKSLL